MVIEDVEIMAPVGSYESLEAAIQAGAGSVYFGVGALNMRAGAASNFPLHDLGTIARRAASGGVRSYLTVNTVVFDEELPQLRQVIDAAREAGITAIIASDLAAILYARQQGVNVHMSTQVNITNIEAVKFYAQFADVMVLARELSLQQVKAINDQVAAQEITGPSGQRVRLEVFVHGALCMAVSGKCYISLHEVNKSANRGQCRQSCRCTYRVTNNDTGRELEVDNQYIMSPKDLKTIHFLDRVLGAGVAVLKIEGRARSPEYVRTTVACYREAVDAYFNNAFTEDRVADWDRRLAQVFNRGFWDGYYLGQRVGEWSTHHGSVATRRKVYLGKGVKYFPNIKVGEFLMETGQLAVGDTILVTGPTTGVIETSVEEIRVDLKPVGEIRKGERFSMKIDHTIRAADKLYKLVDWVGDSPV